ncbi:unnamed protein product [Bursaphelenchus okinawaensis]|uniref:Protein kinase domain-containing protein n=1 Tax=Bursaphelenchus okinawaensis TaxID=465554 RepID=A0A811L396_9BILA|nr:unnamed protein product [Bursaphelenchus okinawaensis]CAG9116737.1 unnamed protein product [Bursaphelenchus okinawaensis]
MKSRREQKKEVLSLSRQLSGDFTKLDFWHGLLPDEDTANILKLDGDYLLRGIHKDGQYCVILSIRWGKNVLNAGLTERNSGGWIFQDRPYDTIKEVVDMLQVTKCPITICNVMCYLDTPVRRKAWELRRQMVKLGKELGQGSYGTVYMGQLLIGRNKIIRVAVKVLTEMTAEASNALWKEARYHQSFDHPNCVKMYGVANDALPYYLVMELVNGGSLDKYLIKKGPKLSVKERVTILLDAAKGLDYLHDKGTLHRDVAARNLLIDSNVVKVADFGMSRKCANYKVDTNKPLNLRWLAPEVYKTQTVNKATDVYAFGVTIYEVFSVPYKIPYEKWDANKVFEEVIEGEYRLSLADNVPPYIRQVFGECIGPEEERPPFKSIVICLRNFQEGKNEGGIGVGL